MREYASAKALRFTESVIRDMTRVCLRHKGVNLSQGFPDFAAPLEFKEAAAKAGAKLLEPIMALEITIPEEFVGDVIGDLNSRRGRIGGVEGGGGRQRVSAKVPLAEILRYATDLTSMTGGRGQFTMALDHYEEVPGQIAEKIIAASRKSAEEEK